MPKFRVPDQESLCEFVIDEQRKRQDKRRSFDKLWKDIDRQLRMEPDLSFKKDFQGRIDQDKAWMPETELPLQAQTLELTSADCMRMLRPDNGMWFQAHAAITDEYLDQVDFQSMITGDLNDVPSKITQDNADKLAAGILDHWHRQYDYWGNLELILGESLKYSMGVGRARLVKARVFNHTTNGVVKEEQMIPMLVPRSVKETYLDDSESNLCNEGYYISPSVIFKKNQKLKDIKKASTSGDGWLPGNMRDLDAIDDYDNVEVIEWEGDIIVPRKTTDSFYLPNGIFTVLIGKRGRESVSRLIRAQRNPFPSSSVIQFPYHREHQDCVYGASPLMKGHPIQVAAVSALNRLIEAGALNTQPPVGYDADDQAFASEGGPQIYPGAKWQTMGEVKIYEIGDVSALSAVYADLLRHYADVTGVNAPRLGQQTLSHTTAYAKEAELARGQVRTVDFVKSMLNGPLRRWLNMAYKIGRDNMSPTGVKPGDVYLEPYNGWVNIVKEYLPENVRFDAIGAAGPQEDMLKWQKKFNSVQQAIQIDQLNMQTQMALGQQPTPILNLATIIEQIMREGNWTDVDVVTNTNTATQPTQQPGLQGVTGINPGTTSTVLQNLAYGGQG